MRKTRKTAAVLALYAVLMLSSASVVSADQVNDKTFARERQKLRQLRQRQKRKQKLSQRQKRKIPKTRRKIKRKTKKIRKRSFQKSIMTIALR